MTDKMIKGLSVIVPVHEKETEWPTLAENLGLLGPADEVIFVATEGKLAELKSSPLLKGPEIHFVSSTQGRARQLNTGARAATRDWFWFLHCDSKFDLAGLRALRANLGSDQPALYFFDLRFRKDGPLFMPLNQWGAQFRSRVLRLPFGDQGFALTRVAWERLGEFDESAPFGEDHLLVWRAHHLGIPVKPVGAWLETSARKYQAQGWSRTTARHLRLTAQQAWPELLGIIGRSR